MITNSYPMITFEKPENIEPEAEKPPAIANADYPLVLIDHRRFEKLTYWIFKAEIENDNSFWSKNYDDIKLLSGVRDKGQDCALYKNKELIGVIQCKHSAIDAALDVTVFAREIIKFGIHAVKDVTLIANPDKFIYYIASSSGFKEKTADLIRDFKTIFCTHSSFEIWAKHVIKNNVFFDGLVYADIEIALKAFLNQITVAKIDREDINQHLHNSYQINTKDAFFQIERVVDVNSLVSIEKGIANIDKKLEEIKEKDSIKIPEVLNRFRDASSYLTNWRSYISDSKKIHIPRNEVNELYNWIRTPLKPNEEGIALLAGTAGSGKTVVLKDLYAKMQDLEIPVLGIKADRFPSVSIKGLEEDLDLRESLFDMIYVLLNSYDKVIILIDQIDALSQALSADRKPIVAYDFLIKKLLRVHGVRIITSIREFDLRYDPNFKELGKNKIVKLGLLSEDEVKDILGKIGVNLNKVGPKLLSMLAVPHHLQVFSSIYYSDLALDGFSDLQNLYEELWRQKVSSVQTTAPVEASGNISLVYAIAKKMYDEQQISINRSLFEDEYRQELDFLTSNNILIASEKAIQFFHQTFYDFVYAKQFVGSNQSLKTFLLQNSQSLHLRSSLKMILAFLRISNESQYLADIKTILTSGSIRFHIKLLALNILGFNTEPTDRQKAFVKRHVFTNSNLKKYFLESVWGASWVKFLIEENILDELAYSKKSNLDKFFETTIAHKLQLSRVFGKDTYSSRREDNVGLFQNLIGRALPEGRKEISSYLLQAGPIPETWVISRVLYWIKIWDSKESIALFNQHKHILQKDWFTICHIFEDALYSNIDWAFSEFLEFVNEIIKNAEEPHSPKFEYDITNFFEKAAKQAPHQTFETGLKIVRAIIDNVPFLEGAKDELYGDLSYMFYDYGKDNYNDHQEIYAIVINLAEDFSKNEPHTFLAFYNAYKNDNSLTILMIIVHAFIANPESYKNQIVEFLSILNSKDGLQGDGKMDYWIRKLLSEIYSSFTQQEKDLINNILLGINDADALRIRTNENGERFHFLRWFGYDKFLYLSALPESEVLAQTALRKVYQELQRKHFQIADREPNVVRISGGGGPPLDKGKIKKMSTEQLERTFTKYSTDNTDFNRSRGGMYEHAQTFQESVKEEPFKYAPLIEKLIIEDKTEIHYWLSGLEGLVEAKYNAGEFLKLYKVAISKVTDRQHILTIVRLSNYLIKNKLIDNEILNFLCDQALNFPDPDKSIDKEDEPLMVGINSVRGSAIEKVIYCQYNPSFSKVIIETVEKAALDKQTGVKAALVNQLGILLHIDEKKTVEIFLTVMKDAPEELVKVSLQTLAYLVHRDFKALIPNLEKWIYYKSSQGFIAAVLFWSWVKGYKGSKKLFDKIWKLSDKAKARVLREAYEHLFDNKEDAKEKSIFIFKKLLNNTSEDVVHEFDTMFLHLKDYTFTEFKPFVKQYVKSAVARKNPHYFFDYLLKHSNTHPTDCIDLLALYKKYPKPNHSKGPYYSDEPTKIALNCYNTLYNQGNQPYVKKAIALFDRMLQVDVLRRSANEALVLIEK